MTSFSFGVSVTTDDKSGELLSVYLKIRTGKVATTQEYADGAVFADYNRHGELVGIELLSPCKVTVVDQLAANESAEVRRRTKKFMRESCPRRMIAA